MIYVMMCELSSATATMGEILIVNPKHIYDVFIDSDSKSHTHMHIYPKCTFISKADNLNFSNGYIER